VVEIYFMFVRLKDGGDARGLTVEGSRACHLRRDADSKAHGLARSRVGCGALLSRGVSDLGPKAIVVRSNCLITPSRRKTIIARTSSQKNNQA
jgi:hypothetical protein